MPPGATASIPRFPFPRLGGSPKRPDNRAGRPRPEYEPKSVGEQETFGEDTRNLNLIFDRLLEMCGHVLRRLRAGGFRTYRTVVITVRFHDFATHFRSRTLAAASGSPARLRFTAMKLLMPFLDHRENPRRKLLRLIGVRLEKLEK